MMRLVPVTVLLICYRYSDRYSIRLEEGVIVVMMMMMIWQEAGLKTQIENLSEMSMGTLVWSFPVKSCGTRLREGGGGGGVVVRFRLRGRECSPQINIILQATEHTTKQGPRSKVQGQGSQGGRRKQPQHGDDKQVGGSKSMFSFG